MTRFLIRRLLNMIPLILGITFISFLAMSLVPGDFVSNLKLNPTITPEVIHQLEAQFGLDQPLMVRYFKWLWGVLHLNFGFSLQYRVSVTGLIASRAFNTIILSASSMIFSWLIAIPIGIAIIHEKIMLLADRMIVLNARDAISPVTLTRYDSENPKLRWSTPHSHLK